MNLLSRLNPANHLYIKLFLWFWLATIIMVSSSVWIFKQLNDEVRFGPMRPPQVNELNFYTQLLQNSINKSPNADNIIGILQRIGQRNQIGLVLVDLLNQDVISSLPHHIRLDKKAFLGLSPESSAISINTGEGIYSGPSTILINSKSYLLFVGKPMPPGFAGSVRRQPPSVMIVITLGISAFLCFLFARSLVNPIRQLQHASQQLASGNLAIRVGSASKRHDEIGRLGRDFNIMSEQVERLIGNQKRLLADISHELRSPLARLQLSIGILQQQSEQLDSERVELHFLFSSVARIEKEAAQIDSMLAQLLMLSRLDNPQSLLHKEVIDIQSLLAPIIGDAQFEARELNKLVSFEPVTEISVEGDVQMLSSAIENVLRNAIKYANKQIDITVSISEQNLIIMICDDGEGIEQNQLSRIFEPFYRESLARDRASGGVGLGLAIAQRAIIKHQGKINACNMEGRGLQVTISLPIYTERELG
jgi:two-component system, OmpR family, sensor histidine kinase CpxA